jgi:hypothetical protein
MGNATKLHTIAALYGLHAVAWCADKVSERSYELLESACNTVGRITGHGGLWWDEGLVQTCSECGGNGSEDGSGPLSCWACSKGVVRFSIAELVEELRNA